MAPTRPLIVLHPKYIDEIKSHPHLDFDSATQKVRVAPTTLEYWRLIRLQNFFSGRIPGFEPFHVNGASRVFLDSVRIKLTQALGM